MAGVRVTFSRHTLRSAQRRTLHMVRACLFLSGVRPLFSFLCFILLCFVVLAFLLSALCEVFRCAFLLSAFACLVALLPVVVLFFVLRPPASLFVLVCPCFASLLCRVLRFLSALVLFLRSSACHCAARPLYHFTHAVTPHTTVDVLL